MTTPDYDTDFYAWTQVQAAAIRAKEWAALDLEHLAEELEALGMNEKRAIGRQLTRLLTHLLKWRYQPTHRTPSWRRSINQARDAISDVLADNRTLRDAPRQQLPLAYRRARRDAIDQTGLPRATFPEACEWPIAQVLDEDFWPEGEP